MEQAQQNEVYPPPPPWYTLYRPDADGSAERPLPPLPPQPPSGDFQVFGLLESAEAGVPPLSVSQQFTVRANGAVDFKRELQRLNKELMVKYLGLIDTLIQQPSSYGRDIEAISTLLRNMHYLLNYLRCHQARASLVHILKTEAQDRRAAIADLREQRKNAEALFQKYASQLEEVLKEEDRGPQAMEN